jgi:hypothetical protein
MSGPRCVVVSGELQGVTRGPRLSAGRLRTPARPWDPVTVHTSLQIEISAGQSPLSISHSFTLSFSCPERDCVTIFLNLDNF